MHGQRALGEKVDLSLGLKAKFKSSLLSCLFCSAAWSEAYRANSHPKLANSFEITGSLQRPGKAWKVQGETGELRLSWCLEVTSASVTVVLEGCLATRADETGSLRGCCWEGLRCCVVQLADQLHWPRPRAFPKC